MCSKFLKQASFQGVAGFVLWVQYVKVPFNPPGRDLTSVWGRAGPQGVVAFGRFGRLGALGFETSGRFRSWAPKAQYATVPNMLVAPQAGIWWI